MAEFREFRKIYRSGKQRELSQFLEADKDDFQGIARCGDFLSEQINKDLFTPELEVVVKLRELAQEGRRSFLDSTSSYKSFTPRKSAVKRLAILIKADRPFPREFIFSVDQQNFSPVVFFYARSASSENLRRDLEKGRIPFHYLPATLDYEERLNSCLQAFEEEHISHLLAYSNEADLDISCLADTFQGKFISFHKTVPLKKGFVINELENLGRGSWQQNQARPSRLTLIISSCLTLKALPEDLLKEVHGDEDLCLLSEDPLHLLSTVGEDLLQNVTFSNTPQEYAYLYSQCKELRCVEENFQENVDLALKYGLALRNLSTSEFYNYGELKTKFSLRRKFKEKVNSVFKELNSLTVKLPRILMFYDSKAAPIIREINKDIIAALENIACPILTFDTSLLSEGSLRDAGEVQQELLAQISLFKPTEALGYNASGILLSGESHLLEKLGIHYTALFFDNPFYSYKSLSHCQNRDLVRILTLDRYYVEPLKKSGFANTHYFPIASSAHLHSYHKVAAVDKSHIIFSATVKPLLDAEHMAVQLDDKMDKDFVHFSFNKIVNDDVYSQELLLRQFYEKYPDYSFENRFQELQNCWFHLDNQGSSRLRLSAVDALQDNRLNIYGGDNWLKFPRFPQHEYLDFLDYKQLPQYARQALAVLCRTPLNIQDGIQQRILDTGAAGGCILTDYRPVLKEHFKIDEELFVYRNTEELQDKASFLRNNPRAAERAAVNLQQRVLKEHTWTQRLCEYFTLL
ncbi:MAG: glycosyltransferase [Lentisphaeraceae bacterium]|nr:glycosyltransferase [Lentisphaeraceae bacterium]